MPMANFYRQQMHDNGYLIHHQGFTMLVYSDSYWRAADFAADFWMLNAEQRNELTYTIYERRDGSVVIPKGGNAQLDAGQAIMRSIGE